MSRAVEILAVDDYPRWDRFVASSPQGSVFQTSGWIAVIAAEFGLRPEIMAVVDEDEIAGGIVVYHKTRMGIRIAARPPVTPYNGVVHAAGRDRKNQKRQTEEAEVTELLLRRIEQEVRYAQFTLSPAIDDVRPYQWCRWNTRVQFTYINDLADTVALWEALSPSLRRKITRAKENAFSVTENGDLDTLVGLQEQSYARSGLQPVLDTAAYRRLCTALREKGIVRIYSISDAGGAVRSARAIVLSGTTAYYWMSGSRPASADDFGSHLLLWEILVRLSAAGFRRFDFMGANTPGIVEFKRSFGGALTNYFDVTWYTPRAIRVLIEANNILHGIRRRLVSEK